MRTILFPQVFYDFNWTLNLFFYTRKKVLEVLKIQVLEIPISTHVLELLPNSGQYNVYIVFMIFKIFLLQWRRTKFVNQTARGFDILRIIRYGAITRLV